MPIRRALGVALIVSAALVGCSTTAEPPEEVMGELALCAADDAACDPYDQVHVLGTWASSSCQFLFDCCASSDRLGAAVQLLGRDAVELLALVADSWLVDRDACLEAVHDAVALATAEDWMAVLDGRRTYDPSSAAQCLGPLADAAAYCVPGLALADRAFAPSACQTMFAPAVAQGGVCYAAADCVPLDGSEAAMTCFSAAGVSESGVQASLGGTCALLPGLGQPCAMVNGECTAGLFCSPAGSVCVPRAAAGESCVGRPCAADSYCAPSTLSCVPKRAEATPCASDEECLGGHCAADLHLCVTPRPLDPLTTEYLYCLGESDHGLLSDFLAVDPP